MLHPKTFTLRPVFKSRTMSSLFGILCLLSALAATSYSYSCSRCSSIGSKCSGNITCPSGEGCGSSYTEGGTGGKNAAFLGESRARSSACSPLDSTSAQQEEIRIINSCCNTDDCDLYSSACKKMANILARTYQCASKCNFSGSMRLQQLQIRMGTICYGNTINCALDGNLPTDNSPLNGLGCPSCLSDNSTWCYTDETIQCRGDETTCLLLQTLESGSMSTSTAFRGCATKSMCDLGSQSKNETGSFTEVKINCTRASTSGSNRGSNSRRTIDSTSGSTNGSMSVHKVVLTPAIVCLLLLKLLF